MTGYIFIITRATLKKTIKKEVCLKSNSQEFKKRETGMRYRGNEQEKDINWQI